MGHMFVYASQIIYTYLDTLVVEATWVERKRKTCIPAFILLMYRSVGGGDVPLRHSPDRN